MISFRIFDDVDQPAHKILRVEIEDVVTEYPLGEIEVPNSFTETEQHFQFCVAKMKELEIVPGTMVFNLSQ